MTYLDAIVLPRQVAQIGRVAFLLYNQQRLRITMNDVKQARKPRLSIWLAVFLAAAAVIAAFVVRRRLRVAPGPALRSPEQLLRDLPVQGLTGAEAAARQLESQDNVLYVKPPRTRKQIWNENAYNVFNLNLVGLAVAQLLLGRPLDALISVGTIALNIGLNIFQELFAQRRLREAAQAARPQATVIRDQKARSIDPSQIVVGDLLVAGPGDQFLVDGEVVGEGQFVVDETALTGSGKRLRKRAGDPVYAGSFCVGGHGALVARRVGDERLIISRTSETKRVKPARTRLERTMERILWALLAVVVVLTALLLSIYFRLDLGIPVEALNDAASVIFGIAPSSLFFMIVLTYAAGTADLGKLGALVRQARSVESLAEATVICFAQAGILTGSFAAIERLEPPEGQEQMAEPRLRQILGDFARSSSVDNLATRSMKETFEGNRRPAHEEAPFLAVYGWSAVAFDDQDLRGVYVLGSPEAMAALGTGNGQAAAGQKGGMLSRPVLRNLFSPLGRVFGRSKEAPAENGNGAGAATAIPAAEPVPVALPEEGEAVEDKGSRPGFLRKMRTRFRPAGAGQEPSPAGGEEDRSEDGERPGFLRRAAGRLQKVLRRGEAAGDGTEAVEAPPAEETVLLFAYQAELVPLHAPDGSPRMPPNLVPLCTVHFSERVRPEAIELIKTFSEIGVAIKVFAAGAAAYASLQQAGLGSSDQEPPSTLSGPELAGLDARQLAQAARETTVFGQITPEQAGQVVAALRAEGETVAVVGDGVSDLEAMRQASLAISRQSSTQAALGLADIVLLGDSPAVLSQVLQKGQRIVNGLLDVLKVQLTQVSYLALLILGIQIAAHGFPYQSAQGTIISISTVVLPSVGLSLWAASGVLPSARLGRLLAWTVVPAAVTMGLAALIVYLVILDSTGDVAYAQLTVTWTLVITGLLLVVLIKPPWPTRLGGAKRPGDIKFTALSLVLMVLFVLVSSIPLAQRFLKTAWLERPQDYLLVVAVSLGWLVTLSLIWWVMSLPRRARCPAPRGHPGGSDP